MHHSQTVPVSSTNKIRAFCRKISNLIASPSRGLWTCFPGPRLPEAYKRQHQEKRYGPRNLHSLAGDADQFGQRAPWRRHCSVIPGSYAPTGRNQEAERGR